MKKVALLLFLCSTHVFAGDTSGTVASYTVQPSGNVFLFSVTGQTASPACNTLARYAADLTTTGGRTVAAAIIAAFAQHHVVTVAGVSDWSPSNACTINSGSEDVGYVTQSS